MKRHAALLIGLGLAACAPQVTPPSSLPPPVPAQRPAPADPLALIAPPESPSEAANCAQALNAEYRAAEEQGAEALARLAERIERQACLGPDPSLAYELYAKAAAQGHLPSLLRRGWMTLRGIGDGPDSDRARALFREAAVRLTMAGGDPLARAQAMLAPRDLPRMLAEEISALRAIDTADAQTQLSAALRFKSGEGLPQNRELAEHYLQQAALKGLPEAQYQAGLVFLEDPEKRAAALKFLYDAALAGHGPAQVELARHYDISPANEFATFRAYVWLLRAQAQGYADRALLRRAEQALEPDKRALAQAWADDPKLIPPPP